MSGSGLFIPDTTPDTFSFTAQSGVALGRVVVSDSITVSGINMASPISVSGGEYCIGNGSWVSAAGTVSNGQTVRVRQTSSGDFNTTTTATLTIGGVNGAFSVTTAVIDTTPDQFRFPRVTGALRSVVVESAAVTITGINAPAAVTISGGGEYSIDGGAWTSSAGTITNRRNVRVRQTSSGGFNTETTATLTIGGVNGAFSTTTVASDTTSVAVSGGLLLVKGSPFIIRGVEYAPTPIGIDPETTAPYGDYFTADQAAVYTRDLPLLRSMGANAVRLRYWDGAADHKDFLDKAYNNGTKPIYVIAGYWINTGQDIDPASAGNVREQLKASFRAMVAAQKNHPAILMWVIGSDLNATWMYGDNTDHLFTLMDEMAAEAHSEEGPIFHPVTAALKDERLRDLVSTYEPLTPNLDLWGVLAYRGRSFGGMFTTHRSVSGKPLVVLGYGIDAYDNSKGAEYEHTGVPYQADYASALWSEISANSDICPGGAITAWSDEWWRGRLGAGCPEADPAVHGACGSAKAGPDGYANEEWWGLMRTKDNGGSPDIMEPRTAYYTLRQLWTGDARKTLTVNTMGGTGTGVVTSAPMSGINCPTDCAEAYNGGTTVTLTAVPDAGSYFAGWSGGGCAGSASCSVFLRRNDTMVSALFNLDADYHIFGGAYNYPVGSHRSSLSLDVTGPNNPGGWVRYAYTSARLNFRSSRIDSVAVAGNDVVITGRGSVNGLRGCRFTATITNGAPDTFGMVIRKADGSTYYSVAPGVASNGDFTVTQ